MNQGSPSRVRRRAFANPFDDRPERVRAKSAALAAVLIAANAAAWLWAWRCFGDRPALIGTGVLAYMLGLRHAFDADHIAAIDNVVRKLMQEGARPLSAGFFFSLGHSTVVVFGSAALAATTALAQSRLSAVQTAGATIGTIISAGFLLAIGLANLVILRNLWVAFAIARERGPAPSGVDELLATRGFYARLFRRLFRFVGRSPHMFPIGFLFGLGFDTATEIGLLGIAATEAAHGLPILDILVFPALFTAGMTLVDTADSALMVGAYGWAFVNPIRKLWYNFTITAASVVVAIFIGGVEALGLAGDRLGLDGAFWRWVGGLNDDLTGFGFAVVGVFAASWLVSTIVYRAKGYDTLRAER